jgi:group I intron endonuclease
MGFDAYIVSRNGEPRYVGVTTRGVDKRWRYGHLQPGGKTKSALKDAIKRHGRDAFVVEHVASARDMAELSDLERILIEQYNTLTPHGYNLKTGGFEGVTYSDEIREKIGAAKRGKKHTPEQRAKNSAAQTGKKMSEAARAKMRARPRVAMAEEIKEKIRAKHVGKRLTDEHKQKLSASHIGKNTGPRGPYPPERGRAISATKAAKRRRLNNPDTQGMFAL